MKFVKIIEEDINLIDKELTIDFIQDHYKDLFTGLGCFPGEYDIEIDQNI